MIEWEYCPKGNRYIWFEGSKEEMLSANEWIDAHECKGIYKSEVEPVLDYIFCKWRYTGEYRFALICNDFDLFLNILITYK